MYSLRNTLPFVGHTISKYRIDPHVGTRRHGGQSIWCDFFYRKAENLSMLGTGVSELVAY